MAATAAYYQPMTIIKLSGSLARKFGRTHRRQLESGATWEAFKALQSTLQGFEEEIRRLDGLGLRFAIFRNRKNIGPDQMSLRGTQEVRIVPVVHGSKRGGILQTIIGIALMVSSIWLGPSAFYAGLSMTLGGVVQMLSPRPRDYPRAPP